MSLLKKVDEQIKEAMKAKDKERLSALRGLKSALFNVANEKGDRNELADEDAIKVLQKQLKQRKESVELYEGQGRSDLAEEEKKQASVIEEFMPEQMGEEEIRKESEKLIEEMGATGPSDIGKVMPEAMKRMGSKADGKLVSQVVKELLSN